MSVSILKINHIIEQLRSHLIVLRRDLTLMSTSNIASDAYLKYVADELNSFGLTCQHFGQGGIADRLAAQRRPAGLPTQLPT